MLSFFSSASVGRSRIPAELASDKALLAYLGLSDPELKKIWWFRRGMYHLSNIAKANGKIRTIYAPNARLKFLQRQILPLLNQLYRVRNPVHGFVASKSVKTNASAHLRKKFILNLDLKDFFPSITERRVRGLLRSLGIDGRVSEIVARLCCYDGYLPQGAPTSPVLSNMVCFRMDSELLAFAKECRCVYTRYADDITFSSHQHMTNLFQDAVPSSGRFSPELLVPSLQNIFSANGFVINPVKAHYADKYSRRMVTGLKVNEVINVDRKYVRNIRAILHALERQGREEVQAEFEAEYGGKSDVSVHLKGKLIWLRHIKGQTDSVFRSLALRFNSVFPERKIEITPTPNEIRERALWVVECGDGQGSAFFLKGVGLVTAAHCVTEAKQIEIFHPSKPTNRFKVSIAKYDNHRDLAILNHDVISTEFYELDRSLIAPSVGDKIEAAGYPGYWIGDKLNLRLGSVSSLPARHGVALVEVTQKLAQGMSGGALLNEHNQVVGIIHKGGASENRDFGIHIDVLNKWLSEDNKQTNFKF